MACLPLDKNTQLYRDKVALSSNAEDCLDRVQARFDYIILRARNDLMRMEAYDHNGDTVANRTLSITNMFDLLKIDLTSLKDSV